MLIVLAVLLALGWVLAFFVLHVTSVAVHTLVILAAGAAIFHFVKPRSFRGPAGEVPPDAVK